MKYTTNIQKIDQMLVGRTALEQELALGLSKVFNTGDLYRRINIAVNASFLFLHDLKSELPLKSTIENLERKNDYLFHANPKTIEGVLADRDKGLWLTPEQCGNLIRFYGEVIEACASFSIYWRKQRAKQISWRYGGGGETFKASRDDNYVAQADKGSVWRKSPTMYKDKDGKEKPIMLTHWKQTPGGEGKGPLWQKFKEPAPDEPGVESEPSRGSSSRRERSCRDRILTTISFRETSSRTKH